MAGSAVVGALRVSLGLDSAQFTTGLKGAQTGLQRFAGIAKTGALAIGGAMIAAGGAMALALKGFIDRADELYEVSQSLGVTVEDLTRMQYAADLSGVSAENLEKALRKLSVGLYDATQSATGPAAQAFHALGISATDAAGNIRPTIDVMGDLAKRFETLPDGAAKTALAVKLFGRTGADLIPMLNEGQAGLQGMYEEAERLGVVLDTETAAAAERFNDNLTRLGKTKDGIVAKISAGMLPALEDLSNSLVTASQDTALLKGVGAGLGWTLKALASTALAVGGTFYALARSIGLAAIVAYKWARQDFAGAAVSLTVQGASIQRTLDSLNGIHTRMWAGGGSGPATVVEDLSRATDDLADSTDRASRSARGLSDSQRDAAAAAREMAQDAAQVFERTRTPAEQYRAEVERLTRMLDAAAISQDTFNRAMREAGVRRDAADPLSQAGARIAEANREAADKRREDAIEFASDHEENLRDATYDGIRGGLEAAADGNLGQYLAQRLRDALFDGLADSLTNMLRGPKGQSGGGAMGWLNAAGSMLKSFGGGKIPGFKTGGSFKVGGSGGSDSQLMQFRATPGEMVDIRRPGQDQGGGAMAVHVVPSPYFDVQVEKVATPIAGRSSLQAFGAARSQVPADDARRRRFSLTGA